MPKRIVHGEGVWGSHKLAKVQPVSFRGELANLIPLASGNGSFACEPRRIWLKVYAWNRPDVTEQMVEQIFDELERVKLLFRWVHTDGVPHGYWPGIEKSGRLPAPSRTTFEDLAPPVPARALAEFLRAVDTKAERTLRVPEAYIGLGIGKGIGIGSESGTGTGTGNGDGGGEPASPGLPAFLSLTKRKPEQETDGGENEGKSGTPDESRWRVNNPAPEEKVAGTTTEQRVPAPEQKVPASRESSPAIGEGNPPADGKSPLSARRRLPSLYRELHPPRITAGDFDAMDYAFTRTESIEDIEAKEIRRIVYYHFRESKKLYWKGSQGNVSSPARFVKVLKVMQSQVPPDFYVPGVMSTKVPVHDPNCRECGGQGFHTILSPAYAAMPELGFRMAERCSCMMIHPAPWRVIYTDPIL
jgi:hypothetical protein